MKFRKIALGTTFALAVFATFAFKSKPLGTWGYAKFGTNCLNVESRVKYCVPDQVGPLCTAAAPYPSTTKLFEDPACTIPLYEFNP